MDIIKGQLSLQLEIMKILYNSEAFAEFEETLLRIMPRMDQKAKDKVMLELRKKMLLSENS